MTMMSWVTNPISVTITPVPGFAVQATSRSMSAGFVL